MSRQPICKAVQDVGANFIFTAKPSSHKTLYEWIDGAEPAMHTQTIKKGRSYSTFRYRWLKDIPLRDGEDALHVNWFEIEFVNKAGKVTYRNSFVTGIDINEDNIVELAAAGRARYLIFPDWRTLIKTIINGKPPPDLAS